MGLGPNWETDWISSFKRNTQIDWQGSTCTIEKAKVFECVNILRRVRYGTSEFQFDVVQAKTWMESLFNGLIELNEIILEIRKIKATLSNKKEKWQKNYGSWR